MPLKAHVSVISPKARPMMVCQRFQPLYGMLVAAPLCRYFLAGDNIRKRDDNPQQRCDCA
jgi:hypothetical protein